MTDDPPKPGTGDLPKSEKLKSPDRQERLAERLRENLKKRKEQARARDGKDEDPNQT